MVRWSATNPSYKPASCRCGNHLLHVVEYTHETITRPGQPSLLVLRCNECPPSEVPWVLVIAKTRLPDRVELDDSRYRDLRSRLRQLATDDDARGFAWLASHDEQPP